MGDACLLGLYFCQVSGKATGKNVFESYAQNNTPGAYRVFWHYGPKSGQITIILDSAVQMAQMR